MKSLVLTILCLAAITFGAWAALGHAQAPTAAAPAAAQWAPAAHPSVMEPSRNIDLDAWESYKNRNAAPSVDRHLTDPILIGAIDLHAHFGPDSFERQWDAFEIAKLAEEGGMRAVVFKNHWSESAGLAYLVRKYSGITHLEVFGGLVLNTPEGGINPEAVRYFAEVEGRYARIVWMPTHDAEHEVMTLGEVRPYVRVSDHGVLLPQVLQVLDLIKQYNLTLATGHVTPDEMLQITSEAKARGITRIIVTHPTMGPVFTDPSLDQMRQAVAMGGYIEIVATELLGGNRDKFIRLIRDVGPQHAFVSTDSGLVGTHNHSDALVLSIRTLRDAGFSEEDLDRMFRRNPAWLIGLPPQ